jgi:Zn-dependent protease
MLRSFTILSIHGIAVRVHPSFGILLLWVIFHWGIQSGGGIGQLLFGLTLLVTVFAFVVLHELGHSLMAMQYGVRVHDITLLPIGGVARLDHVPNGARREAGVALAGPAVNVAITALLLPLLLAYGAAHAFSSMSDYMHLLNETSFGGMLASLIFVNIALVIFNLAPVFPLDGGRIFRAILSAFVGRDRATRVAVAVGQCLAVFIGIVGVMAGDFVLPLMALFVIFAAYGEGRAVKLEAALRRLHVGQFALWDMGGISPDRPLRYALRGGPRDIAVTDGGHVVGMLWRRQVLSDLAGGASELSVADVMDQQVVAVNIGDSVYEVQQRMRETGRWAVPVIEDGYYRGIFTTDRFIHVYRYVNGQHRSTQLFEHVAGRLGELRTALTRPSRTWWRRGGA